MSREVSGEVQPRTGVNNLIPPHTSRFSVGRQKIFTFRLVCGEFRQVCDKIWACRAISNSARSRNFLTDQDARLNHLGHVSVIGAILSLDESVPSLDAVDRDKQSASVRQADGPTNFNPILTPTKTLQLNIKKISRCAAP